MPIIDADAFRIEPISIDATLAEGLRARIADPGWLPARLLQLGELRGEDAGSPAGATVWTRTSRLTRFLPRLPDGTAGTVLEVLGPPLEARIENEPEPRNEPAPRLAVILGQYFLRRLAAAPRPSLDAYRVVVQRRYRLDAVPAGADADPILAVAPHRALDGQLLCDDLLYPERDTDHIAELTPGD